MIKSWIGAASAITVLLTGCASHVTVESVPQAIEQRIEWVNAKWAVCDEPDCLRRTPKTVELLAQAPVVLPRAPQPTKTPEPTPRQVQQQVQQQETPKAQQRAPVVLRFAFAKAEPAGDWRAAIDSIVEAVRPGDLLLIKGYTDDVGSTAYNGRLALRRAEAVAAVLKRRGIKNPMEVEAHGKCCYVASNSTEQGREQNRRVEVHFISKGDRM